MSTYAAGHLPPGALAARRGLRWHALLRQKGGADRIAPNSGSPRAWASEPSCGGGTRSQALSRRSQRGGRPEVL